jgi:beta-propeller uncharacterized protein DUF5122
MFGCGRLGLKPADAAADAGRVQADFALTPRCFRTLSSGRGGPHGAACVGDRIPSAGGVRCGVGGIASDVTSEPGGNVVVDPATGRIIVANGFREVTAFRPDGSPDRTFDIFVGYDGGPMTRQPLDGKLLFVGYDYRSNALRMQRYDADGNVDGSFGTDGVVTMPAESFPSAAIVQLDGRIVVGWRARSGAPCRGVIACFLSDGTPDLDFGTGGVRDTGASGPRPSALLADDGGKVVVAGKTAGSKLRQTSARFSWKWRRSGTILASDYGAPQADDTFLCLFDDSGATMAASSSTERSGSRAGSAMGPEAATPTSVAASAPARPGRRRSRSA